MPREEESRWSSLTPDQKRQERIDAWCSSIDSINFNNQQARAAYQIRMERLISVYNVTKPDRVPAMFHLGNLPLVTLGETYFTGMHNNEKLTETFIDFNRRYAEMLDSFANPVWVPPASVFELLDYKLYAWPGQGLTRNASSLQYREGEYMKADEYPRLIENPTDFWLRVYLPRVFGTFNKFQTFDPVTNIIEIPTAHFAPLSDTLTRSALQKLIQVGEDMERRDSITDTFSKSGLEAGFPTPDICFCKAPFDVIGDTLRGTMGITMDMYRHSEELLEAMDVIANVWIRSVIDRARANKSLLVSFPLHKGADGWMSQKQFEKFYWPSLKKVINAFIKEGLMIRLFAEGSYNSRLENINEFPRGFVHWWFDQTDMARAKKILGNNCSIQGNVPSSLLMTGTPSDIKRYSRNLIETCAPGGGFILAPGSVDVEAKIENVVAMVNSAREYGIY